MAFSVRLRGISSAEAEEEFRDNRKNSALLRLYVGERGRRTGSRSPAASDAPAKRGFMHKAERKIWNG